MLTHTGDVVSIGAHFGCARLSAGAMSVSTRRQPVIPFSAGLGAGTDLSLQCASTGTPCCPATEHKGNSQPCIRLLSWALGVALLASVAAAAAEHFLRHLRERPGAAARAVARRADTVRGEHAGRCSSRSSTSASAASRMRLGAGRHGAGGGGRAQRRRGLGRQPPVRQRQHRRRRRRRRASCARCWSATSRATSCSPARAATARSSPRRIAASSARIRRSPPCRAPAIRSSRPPGVGARRRLGLRRRRTSAATLGGTPLRIVHALRRHAARARGDARRQHRLRRGLPVGQPDDGRARGRWSATASSRHAVPRPAQRLPGAPGGNPGSRRPTSKASPRPRSA